MTKMLSAVTLGKKGGGRTFGGGLTIERVRYAYTKVILSGLEIYWIV